MKIRHPLTLAIMASALLTGCSGNPSAQVASQVANRDLELQFSPIRFVASPVDSKTSMTTVEWAGAPGQSILNNAPQVKADVLRSFKTHCNFDVSQLSEVRVVKHKPPMFYEVWVFDDPQSQREDKKSGISVVLKQLPNNGGVDFSFRGDCHSQKAPTFYFTKGTPP